MSLARKDLRNGTNSFRSGRQGKKTLFEHAHKTNSLSVLDAREAPLRKGSRDNRICHSGRSFSSDSHPCHNGFQTKIGRTVASDSIRDIGIVGRTGCITAAPQTGKKANSPTRIFSGALKQWTHLLERHGIGKAARKDADDHYKCILKGITHNEKGQSTVEYAVIVGTSIAIVVALGLLAQALNDGMFIEHAINSASHNIHVLFGGTADVFSY